MLAISFSFFFNKAIEIEICAYKIVFVHGTFFPWARTTPFLPPNLLWKNSYELMMVKITLFIQGVKSSIHWRSISRTFFITAEILLIWFASNGQTQINKFTGSNSFDLAITLFVSLIELYSFDFLFGRISLASDSSCSVYNRCCAYLSKHIFIPSTILKTFTNAYGNYYRIKKR